MDVTVGEAEKRFSQLLRAAEGGESVVITRKGQAIAQLAPPPPARRKVRFGSMRERIHLHPGWDDPVDLNRFLESGL